MLTKFDHNHIDSQWNGEDGDVTFSATLIYPDNGGTPVLFQFTDAKTGVDITNPSSPDSSNATSTVFGFEGTGFGPGVSSVGRFSRGEQFSFQCDHRIYIEDIKFREYTEDEAIHVAWTDNGEAQSAVFTLDEVHSRAEYVYELPTPLIADANTPIIISNVSAASAHYDGLLRVESLLVNLVLDADPYFEHPSDDGFVQMFGVNLAGAEFTTSAMPGTFGTHYFYPSAADFDYYQSKGLNLIRLPFRWERLQPTPNSPLNSAELDRLQQTVALADARGMKVILDMHNYARYYGELIGSANVPNSAYEDVWARIADSFEGNSAIYGYGIMNEPHNTNGQWPAAAQAAVDGIRSEDANTWIIVAGDGWSGSANWAVINENLNITDSSDLAIYEAHCYLDWDRNGVYAEDYDEDPLVSSNVGIYQLHSFVQWLKDNNARGFVGEYGVPYDDDRWHIALEKMLRHMGTQGISGTYWAGGAYWTASEPLSCQPRDNYTTDRPHMQVLEQDFAFYEQNNSVDIIIDDGDLGFSTSSGWYLSSLPGYDGDYLHDNNSGGSKWAKWQPESLTPGNTEIYLYWIGNPNRADNASLRVYHPAGANNDNGELYDTFVIDMQVGGDWSYIGEFTMDENSYVRLLNDGANGYVIADAALFRQTGSTASVEVVVDNNNNENLDGSYTTKLGTWFASTSIEEYHGVDYDHEWNSSQLRTFSFIPNIPTAGTYDVYLNWASHANRASNAKTIVNHANGSDEFAVDQRTSGGQWNLLGSFDFESGVIASQGVIISNDGADGIVVADAILFVKN
ncbi:hypothetical protein GCM10007047_24940 [Cerasicoccus arenae]|uniref:Glycoside hydrolase family 5 domain-containing protein n=1 Tax=Cerasicoccus arenae TaxID=424488 RepID=A0A8J3DBP9_9BACT|nr:hypothetical protein GCM10007047_24940 [Cerasicoccus arenae]